MVLPNHWHSSQEQETERERERQERKLMRDSVRERSESEKPGSWPFFFLFFLSYFQCLSTLNIFNVVARARQAHNVLIQAVTTLEEYIQHFQMSDSSVSDSESESAAQK